MTQEGSYKALVVDQADGKTMTEITQLSESDLPEGDVTVRVAYSSLNYKDGLALTGSAPIIRNFPMTPGIDFAGEVESSESSEFSVGDQVVLTGWGVGERHPGGYGQRARVKADWLEALPAGLTAQQAMAIGTAGFTAMLCVIALEKAGLEAGAGPVVVTGAAGGVGSVAVAILAHLGHEVVAVTGREACHDYLLGLGAAEIVARAELAEAPDRPLLKERWAGCVDTVGGDTLAHVLSEMRYRSSVAACGLAGGAGLKTTVLPFILRGVTLLGIDSVMCPRGPRREAWSRLASDLPAEKLEAITEVVPLERAAELGAAILKGEVRGRIVIDVNA